MGIRRKRLVPAAAFANAVRCAALWVAATIGTFAYAEDSAAPASGSAQKTAPADKLVCKQEPVIGSNIKRRVCKRQSQIDEERDAARQGLNDLNKSGGRPQASGS